MRSFFRNWVEGLEVFAAVFVVFTLFYQSENADDHESKIHLVVFSVPNCVPCDQLKADLKSGIFGKYGKNALVVKHDGKTWDKPELVEKYEKFFKKKIFDGFFPMSWIEPTVSEYEGYENTKEGREAFMKWLKSNFKHSD